MKKMLLKAVQLAAACLALTAMVSSYVWAQDAGKQIYDEKCAACHGAKGEGAIGSSLSAGSFLAMADNRFLFRAITEGRPEVVAVTTLPGGPVVPRALLGNGDAYDYRPQLAYIDPDGTAWLVDAGGADRLQLMEGCTGIGSAKRGDVLNGGLVWSPEGGHIAC